MDKSVVQFFSCMVGCTGFLLMLRVRKGLILSGLAGCVITWLVYLSSLADSSDVFFPTFLASFVGSVYGIVAARILKAPSTLFFTVSMLPLIPGSRLYYCMSGIVEKDYYAAAQNGISLLQYTLGIAAGLSISWAIWDFIQKIIRKMKGKPNQKTT